MTCTLYASYIVAKAERPYCGLPAPQLIIIESYLQRLFYTPIDKMHVAKTKHVVGILYGRLIGILMTMPLYDYIDHTLLSNKGGGISIQRFYILLSVDLYQFYAIKKVTLHS